MDGFDARTRRRIFLKRLPLHKFLFVFLGVLLVFGPLGAVQARLQDGCSPRTRTLEFSISSSLPSTCCCAGTTSCCCDVKQNPQAAFPDMALVAVSGTVHNPAPRCMTLDVSSRIAPLSQILTSLGGWMGTGPPVHSSRLIDFTLRC